MTARSRAAAEGAGQVRSLGRPARDATRRDPRVAIIGGGWGGIAAAVELRQRGVRSLTIFERNGGLSSRRAGPRYTAAAPPGTSTAVDGSTSVDETPLHARQDLSGAAGRTGKTHTVAGGRKAVEHARG